LQKFDLPGEDMQSCRFTSAFQLLSWWSSISTLMLCSSFCISAIVSRP